MKHKELAVKNCPFCGEHGQIKTLPSPFRHGWVGCPECKVYINWSYDEKSAIQKWNKRVKKNVA